MQTHVLWFLRLLPNVPGFLFKNDHKFSDFSKEKTPLFLSTNKINCCFPIFESLLRHYLGPLLIYSCV